MRDIRYSNKNVRDFELDSNGDIAVVDNAEAVKEAVVYYLQTFLGDIYVDLTKGVNYFGIVFNNQTTLMQKKNEIQRNVLKIEDIISVDNIDIKFQNKNREMLLELKYTSIYGQGEVSFNG